MNTYLGDPEEGMSDTSNIIGEQEPIWTLMNPLEPMVEGMKTESTCSSYQESALFEVNHETLETLGTLDNNTSVVGINVLVMWCKKWHVGKVVSVSPDSGFDSCGRILRVMYTVLFDDGDIRTMCFPRIKVTHEQFVNTPGVEALRVIILDMCAPDVPKPVQESEATSLLFGSEAAGSLIYLRNLDPMSPISMSVMVSYEGVDRIGICVGRNIYWGSNGSKREFLYMVAFDDNVTRLLTCDEMIEGSQAFSSQYRVPIRAVW